MIVDLVPNHTLSDHVWLREAVASPPGSDARLRYHFLDGRGPGGELPPSDWQSVCGPEPIPYLGPHEYHHAFDLLSAPWDAKQVGSIIDVSLPAAHAVGSNSTWVLSNHDVVRHATRYGLPAGVEPGRWLFEGPPDLLDAERGAVADVLAFERPDGLRCVVNMGEEPVALPHGNVALASGPIVDGLLPRDTAAWLN